MQILLDCIIVGKPDLFEVPQNLFFDKGFSGEPALEALVLRGFILHIKSRGEEKKAKEHNSTYKAIVTSLLIPLF